MSCISEVLKTHWRRPPPPHTVSHVNQPFTPSYFTQSGSFLKFFQLPLPSNSTSRMCKPWVIRSAHAARSLSALWDLKLPSLIVMGEDTVCAAISRMKSSSCVCDPAPNTGFKVRFQGLHQVTATNYKSLLKTVIYPYKQNTALLFSHFLINGRKLFCEWQVPGQAESSDSPSKV